MEDHGAGCHPLLHAVHLQPAHVALTYGAWDPTPLATFDVDGLGGEQHQLEECFATTPELRDALAELDAARDAHQAELRRVESEAARLVASAAAERDELRRHCHSLLLLLHHHTIQAPPPPQTQSILDQPLLLHGAGAMDEHVVTVVSPTTEEEEADAELVMALAQRPPEKGRLVEAVVSAGPLLQTLLLAGPLPRWRHPPPPAPADVIPPFNPGRRSANDNTNGGNYSFSYASSSLPESNCSGGAPPVAAQQQQHALPACFHMMSSSFCM